MTLHSLYICRLTLACISSEISTKLLGMPTHPDWPSLTASFSWPLSTALLRHPSPTAFSEFLFPTLWLVFPCPLPVVRRSRAQAFVWFCAKTNKKIVCLAHPLHSVAILYTYIFFLLDNQIFKKSVKFVFIIWNITEWCTLSSAWEHTWVVWDIQWFDLNQ